ncbi:MAG: dynamin family protein [Smithellaceae bacterium]|jgi:GTP-binding protein EngB required for normal cell division
MENNSNKITLSHIRDLLQTVHQATDKFQLSSLTRQLEAADNLLLQNPPIDVAVLGQFKAGKSSFLNSLLGQNVLPVGAIPVTTAITRLQYGERERAVVQHFNGKKTEIPLADIVEFTSEAGNPGNEKNVAIADIELPSLQKYPGVRLVDTPGLGSIFKYHEATSESWLPAVGTALLAVSSDRPLSQHDLDLIRELTSHTPNIILLLTKVDLLSKEQQEEVTAFFSQTLQRELHRTLPVYLYSTKNNTDEYRISIEQDIFQTIAANRDYEFLRILHYKTQSLAQSCLGYLRIALQSSLQADLNREGLRNQILNEKVNESLMREELGIIAREHQRQTRPLIATYLEPFSIPLIKKVKNKLEKDIPAWQGNLWQLSRYYESWIAETLSGEMHQLSKTEHIHFLGTLKKAHAKFSRSLEAFRKFLDENIENVLGVRLAQVDWNIDVAEPDHPDIAFTKSFDIHLDLLWFLIPMFLFRRIFERHFISGVPKEVEINLSRLAYQWEKSVNNAVEAMRLQAITYIQEELATIESLLSRAQGQTENINQVIMQIEKLSASLPA